ncbi:hypothetical protein SLE2022_078210 [Rubroshorea leprosula]
MAASTPHFVLVPLMSQSHLIPFTDMAKALAQRGLIVTLVMAPEYATQFTTLLDEAKKSRLIIQFLEAKSTNGSEKNNGLPSQDLTPQFFDASNMMQEPLENWLQELEKAGSLPHCIVSDFCLPWTSDLSRKFGIPKLVFHTVSCFTLFCSHNIDVHKPYDRVESDSDPFLVPDVPDRILFTKAQLPTLGSFGSDQWTDIIGKFKSAEKSADGVMVNSFEEMEPAYIVGYKKQVKSMWCIGPLALCNKTAPFHRGNKASIDEHECLSWLNSKKEKSVIYVCFGSISRLCPKQLMELGLGLESSGSPFIWIIKKADCSSELENWFAKERFVERIEERGLIIRGWAPQVLILSHQAIGGFLTHCGWNSTLEGVSFGLPMITWPMFAEQFYNENFVVEVLKIGVKVGVEVPMQLEEEKAAVLVKRGDVEKAVKELMEGGEEGEKRRKRATELREMAKKAVEEGGSSFLNTMLLIEYIKQLKNKY